MGRAYEEELYAEPGDDDETWAPTPEQLEVRAKLAKMDAEAAEKRLERERKWQVEHPREWRAWRKLEALLIDPFGGYDFERFLAEVGPRPRHSRGVRRVNRALRIQAGNLRWADPPEALQAPRPAAAELPRKQAGRAASAGEGPLTAEQVAERLGCHVSTVHKLYHSGDLEGFSLTGRGGTGRGRKGRRFRASSVEGLVQRRLAEEAARKASPPAPAPESILPRPTPRHR